MTWRETISKASAYLGAKGVPDAQTAGELLAARLLKVGRGFLVSSLEREVEPRHLEAMRRAMTRLVRGEPLQYVLGEWDFRSLTLKCDSRALIPRPETEALVTRALEWLRDGTRRSASPTAEGRSGRKPFVVDVGTGTGAIILSLAKEYEGAGVFLGTDVSEDAIRLARENAERTGLANRVKFAVADGLDDFDEPESIDLVISNPPYVATAVMETLDRRVRDFEPRLALDGGAEGLDFYERYLADALNLLKPGGAVLFEIGEDQGPSLLRLFAEYGFRNGRVERDLAGLDRYAFAEI